LISGQLGKSRGERPARQNLLALSLGPFEARGQPFLPAGDTLQLLTVPGDDGTVLLVGRDQQLCQRGVHVDHHRRRSIRGVIGGVLASRNVTPSRVARFIAVRVLEFDRTVPDIVFALIFIVAFGLGPLPGVLAITLHTAGTLGKLFAEVIENIDMKPVEGVQAAGGTWLSQIRFGVLPHVLSNFASYALLRFEVNVRGAAVIGFVGAGGIGQELITAIRKFYYSDVSAILLMLLACVIVIDILSERLRTRLLQAERRA